MALVLRAIASSRSLCSARVHRDARPIVRFTILKLTPLPCLSAIAAPREAPAEARVLLRGVSWGIYERLLAEHEESAGPRFTYDDGFLEILTLSLEHEEPNRRLAALVSLILVE